MAVGESFMMYTQVHVLLSLSPLLESYRRKSCKSISGISMEIYSFPDTGLRYVH